MQPVDFSVWQAGDGTWQLESCIRKTAVGGHTRLLYRWEGSALNASDWRPVGISMLANVSVGEDAGGLQAPHVTRHGDTWHKFYGTWRYIAQAVSSDGKAFTRVLDPATGRSTMFDEGGNDTNTRDPMLFTVPAGPGTSNFHLVYSAYPGGLDADYARVLTARSGNASAALRDIDAWRAAHSHRVAAGGSAGQGKYVAECPFVLYHPPSRYYFLFRTQHYGPSPPPGGDGGTTRVYASPDPSSFGVGAAADAYLVAVLPVCAPEVVALPDGRFVLAALKPGLDGIRATYLTFA